MILDFVHMMAMVWHRSSTMKKLRCQIVMKTLQMQRSIWRQ